VRWGWPRPVYEIVTMWWDSGDPALRGPDPVPPERVLWSGVVLNPLIVGVTAWLSLCVPRLCRRMHRRRRRKAGRCVFCGYPAGLAPVCTECGRAPSYA
jgi:hypothetical protein